MESVDRVFLLENLVKDFSRESQKLLILSERMGLTSLPSLVLPADSSLVLRFAQQPPIPPEVIIAVKNVLMMGIRKDPSPMTKRMGRM